MGGGMMGPKKKMARGGPVKRMGGGMMGPKKKTAKMMGGGMMGPKKKTAKMMGGGMMGPKKKMAKGGAMAKAKSRKPSGRINLDDLKRARDAKMPTGRSAAAKRLAGRSKKTASILGGMKQGKGNPAGKDMSLTGRIKALLGSKKPKAKSMDMGPAIKRRKGLGSLAKGIKRKTAGKRK